MPKTKTPKVKYKNPSNLDEEREIAQHDHSIEREKELHAIKMNYIRLFGKILPWAMLLIAIAVLAIYAANNTLESAYNHLGLVLPTLRDCGVATMFWTWYYNRKKH